MRNRGLSSSAFALALLCASAWWGAFTAMVMLHDDAKFVATLSATLDKPAVRVQLGRWLATAVEHGARLSGADATGSPIVAALRDAVGSKQKLTPVTTALTGVAVKARDAAVAQLDARQEPKHPVRLELGPLFDAAKIPVDTRSARELGLSIDKKVFSTQLLSAQQLDALQRRYDWTRLLDSWAGWVALALLAVAVLSSAKPLRTLALAGAAVALIAVLAPVGLSRLAERLTRNVVGDLLQPLVTATARALGPYTPPALAVGLFVAVGCGVLQLLSSRRAAA